MPSPIHLFLLQGCALINELVQQLFQHFYHTTALELIGIGLWCTDSETLWILLKEDVDTLLSFLELKLLYFYLCFTCLGSRFKCYIKMRLLLNLFFELPHKKNI